MIWIDLEVLRAVNHGKRNEVNVHSRDQKQREFDGNLKITFN